MILTDYLRATSVCPTSQDNGSTHGQRRSVVVGLEAGMVASGRYRQKRVEHRRDLDVVAKCQGLGRFLQGWLSTLLSKSDDLGLQPVHDGCVGM